jgi:uncharacterized OsmC-like protein
VLNSSSAIADRLAAENIDAGETAESKAKSVRNEDAINGLPRDQLDELARSLGANREAAKFKLRAKNRWIHGTQSISLVSSFYGMGREHSARAIPFIQKSDTPPVLLGKDEAPSPMEQILVALAASVTTSLAFRAAVAGIPVQEIECDAEGDIDFHGLVNPSTTDSNGFQQIRVTVQVKCDASEEQIAALCASSPVLATLTKPVPVMISIDKK